MQRAFPHILLLAITFACVSVSTAQFVEDFNDQDLTNGPVWTGNNAVFTVNASGQLQLNDVIASSAYLQTDVAMASINDMEWRIRVDQNFSPSSSNFGRVYLVSDQANLQGPLNGYYLQFGESGSLDAIELFEQSGTNSNSVCRGADGQVANPFSVGVRVVRDALGNWELWVDPLGGTDHVFAASGSDLTHTSGAHLGVSCTYTVSNANKFFYDDVYAGPIIVDTAPPTITAVEIIDPSNIDVLFNEPVDQATAELTNNYDIQPFLSATSAMRDAVQFNRVHLTLTDPLTNGNTYNLIVNGVEDLSGNAIMNAQFPFDYIVPDVPLYREVVINEVMADPTPVVGLPDAEFVELHNKTSSKSFELANWTFSDASTTITLPSYTLLPGAFVVLATTANAPLFGIPNALGVSSLPSLNNDSDQLKLKDDQGNLLDAVNYELAWYQDAVKDDGGWTLEQVDPTTPCSGSFNWRASNAAAGGTPGVQNSIYAVVPDVTAPVLTSVFVNAADQLTLVFSETLDSLSVLSAGYAIVPPIAISTVSNVAPNYDRIVLELASSLVIGQLYTITVTDLNDCPGNAIGAANTSTFALPEPVQLGDLILNEVLYDPRVGGSDFVELYNKSDKVLTLAGLRMANVSNGLITNSTLITSDAILLLPGEYILLSPNTANILAEYPLSHPDRFFQTTLPSYNNGNGTVVLQDPAQNTLDRFSYDDDLHFPLLNEIEGVSLERVDPARSSSDPTNWHSASELVGWATPGYRNSQYSIAPEPSGVLNAEPAIFSPDNDGYQDLITLTYRFDAPGFVGNMSIFDAAGREVRKLMENELLGIEGAISWDGLMDSQEKARIGPYIVYFEVFDLSGNVEQYRKTVVLAHALN